MARKRSEQDRSAALDKALQGMFRALERRPLPGKITSIVDQLEEPSAPMKKSG